VEVLYGGHYVAVVHIGAEPFMRIPTPGGRSSVGFPVKHSNVSGVAASFTSRSLCIPGVTALTLRISVQDLRFQLAVFLTAAAPVVQPVIRGYSRHHQRGFSGRRMGGIPERRRIEKESRPFVEQFKKVIL